MRFLYLTPRSIRCRVFSNENRRNTCLQTAIWSGYGGLRISALIASMSAEKPFQKTLCCGIISCLRGDNETSSFLQLTVMIRSGTAAGSVEQLSTTICLFGPTRRPFFKAEESRGATCCGVPSSRKARLESLQKAVTWIGIGWSKIFEGQWPKSSTVLQSDT